MFSELYTELTDWSVFTDSLGTYIRNLSVNSAIVTIMMVFMFVGAVDKARGNKLGYGEAFDEGFRAMGSLAIAMVGVIASIPILCMILNPIVGPVYQLMGTSPALFGGTLFAADSGGYNLAVQLAGDDVTMGQFSGIIVGCTMGNVLLFDIPVALTLMKKEDRPVLACGILVGVITVPIGCLVGGMMMTIMTPYHMDFLTLILAVFPVMLVAVLLAAGLWFKPVALMNGFTKFGTVVTGMIAIFAALAVFQYETGIRFPLLYKMVEAGESGISPLMQSVDVLGDIAFVLLGAFPMVEWLKRHFGKVMMKYGKKIGMDEASCAGLVATLANNVPTFSMVKDMNPKGKLLNIAFATAAAFMFGDHLGFVAGVSPTMIVPMILAKIGCGFSALLLGNILAPKLLAKAGLVNERQGG